MPKRLVDRMTKHSSECSEDIESLVLDDESESPSSVVEPTQPITCQERRRLSETDASNPRQASSLLSYG